MIRLDMIKKRYGEREVLKEVTLQVEKGELLSLVGPSGCGKTTTLNIVAGLCRPDDGSVLINQVLVEGRSGNKRVHVKPADRRIGYVFQDYALFPNMKVYDNVSYGLKARHMQEDEVKKRTLSLLEFVGLSDHSEHYPHELSGGQKQRIALARALATDPEVLLLDEPLAALDSRRRASIRTDFRNILRTLRVTSIYVTHDLAEACTVSDRIAVMGSGRIEQVGHLDHILEKPNSSYVAEFLGLNVYSGRVASISGCHAEITINGTVISAGSVPNLHEGHALITIRPEDVILSSEPTSGNPKWCKCKYNSLVGTITEIIRMKSNAKVTVDVGFPIESELTLSTLGELSVEVGRKVHVHFKADSVGICQDVNQC
jgi:ABC-type Fe3+/spermidine/putrescine transport system ATPase subunit